MKLSHIVRKFRRGRGVAVLAATMSLFAATAPAAELFYMDHDALTGKYVGAVGPLVISGDIIVGDYDRLLSKIADDENRFMALNTLIVASEQGDVAEALKIAQLVKSLYSQVTVSQLTGKCIGACFFIYAAASRRETDGEHLLGIHRCRSCEAPAVPPTAEGVASAAGNDDRRIREYLRENDVPDSLVQAMFGHAATEVYWLSAEDEKRLGTRSTSFERYLKAQCAWDDAVELGVYSGGRPFADLAPLLACRDRVTRAAAHKTLAVARHDHDSVSGVRKSAPQSTNK